MRRNQSSAARAHDVVISATNDSLCLTASKSAPYYLPQASRFELRFLERHGHFVVAETAPSEGCTVLLVDETTGSRRSIDNPPLFTPSKDFFASASYDTDAGYLSNRVATHLRVRYSRTPYSTAPDDRTGSFSIWRHNGIWRDDSTTSEALGQDQRESSL